MKKIVFIILIFTSFSYGQKQFLNEPLVSEIFTADPSAHLFNGKIYVYPSHDIIEKNPLYDDCGSQYAMRDYRVLSMDYIGGPVTIHDVALDLDDVPWAKRQFWAPDAAEKDGKYYLYFPTKDKNDISHYNKDTVSLKMRKLFDDAVKKRLVSDVNLGIFLSGGIDSSLIVASLAKQGYSLPCFTMGYADASDYSYDYCGGIKLPKTT